MLKTHSLSIPGIVTFSCRIGSRPSFLIITEECAFGMLLWLPLVDPLNAFSGEHEYGRLHCARFYPVILFVLIFQEGGAA